MAKVLLFALFASARAARTRHHESQSGPGQVDGLFTFGAPGTARPAFTNDRSSDGCFPGLRAWTATTEKPLLFEQYRVDTVVPLAGNLAGYLHPKQRGVELHISKSEAIYAECSDENTNFPRARGNSDLHEGQVYVDAVSDISPSVENLTKIATQFSYNRDDSQEVAEAVREFGYGLVGTGFDSGESSPKGGPQVSHLFQIKETLECLVTFQGSSSLGDWLGNADALKVRFCGREERVHRGFRNHFRRMVQNPSWQSNVRPHLGKCSKVYVVGHSLGGAMSELFTACTAHAPAAGEPGFDEDYQYIGWSKESAARLPYF